MQLALPPSLHRFRSDVPAFARELTCARLEAPFRAGVVVIRRAPDEVVLTARLHLCEESSVPVHWEIARDVHMTHRERYGLISVRAGEPLRLVLDGLEAGRSYWYRLWAGGHWSRTGHFVSGPRGRSVGISAARVPRVARSLLLLQA